MDDNLLHFIRTHGSDNPDRLLLSKGKWPEIDMDLAVNSICGRKKMASKLPEWAERDDLLYPTKVCAEQCSSKETAQYKAGIVAKLFDHKPRIADLTAGLGVDSWAFAHIAEELLHNEANEALSICVKENFEKLALSNVRMSSQMVREDNVGEILRDFAPELVFMDPSRRSDSGRKVFLLKDCSPDVLKLKDKIFQHCRYILLKLSPMADISMVVESLGKVKEVHTVAYGKECKELLVLLDRDLADNKYDLYVNESGNILKFGSTEERLSRIRLPEKNDVFSKSLIFEPGKALAKAGVLNALCDRFKLIKLGKSSSLYLAAGQSEEMSGIGKLYNVKEVRSFDNRNLKELGKTLGWADVSAKNIPMSSEELGKKMGLSAKNAGQYADSGSVPHIFGTTVDYSDAKSEKLLFVCKAVLQSIQKADT